MIGFLICCHLCGDFLLQNEWMQTKSKSSHVCSVHVVCYSIPFILLKLSTFFFYMPPGFQLYWWELAAIFTQHWIQDRFALHLKWMQIAGNSSPDKWPIGPLVIDQAMHLTFIGLIAYLALIGVFNF